MQNNNDEYSDKIKKLKNIEIDLIIKLTYKIKMLVENGASKEEIEEKYPVFSSKYITLVKSLVDNTFNETEFIDIMKNSRTCYDPGSFFRLV